MVRVVGVHEHEQAILDELAVFPDPHDRLAQLIRRAERRPGLGEAERSDDALVRGCVSRVWLVGSLIDGRCHFRVAADSPMVMGLVGMVCDVYDGVAPAEAASIDVDILARAGLDRSISAQSNGAGSIPSQPAMSARTRLRSAARSSIMITFSRPGACAPRHCSSTRSYCVSRLADTIIFWSPRRASTGSRISSMN